MMKKRNILFAGGVMLLLAGSLLTGCTSKEQRLEKETAYRKIGLNAMEEGDYEKSIDAFNSALEQAKEIGANEVDICYYKAAAQFAAGDYTKAVETYDALLEYDKKNADAYFLRGCVYLKKNESDQAKEDFKKAVKYAANDEIYLSIYNSLAGAGCTEDANAYLEEALGKKAGRDAKNYTVKGRFYLIKEQYDNAVEQLVKAVEKGDVEANLYLAQAYEALGNSTEQEQCIDAYIKEYPKSSVAYNKQGLKAMESGDYETAISEFSAGLEADEVTNEQELRSNLIAAYEYNLDFDKAKELMQAYLADYPEDEAAAREYLFLNKNRNEENSTE